MEIFSHIIGRQGIYKESRQFFAVVVSDLVFESQKCSLKLTLLGSKYAVYRDTLSFEDIPGDMERQFLFGYVELTDIQQQLEEGEEKLSFFVMYIGELVLGDQIALDKFQKEDTTFWSNYL